MMNFKQNAFLCQTKSSTTGRPHLSTVLTRTYGAHFRSACTHLPELRGYLELHNMPQVGLCLKKEDSPVLCVRRWDRSATHLPGGTLAHSTPLRCPKQYKRGDAKRTTLSNKRHLNHFFDTPPQPRHLSASIFRVHHGRVPAVVAQYRASPDTCRISSLFFLQSFTSVFLYTYQHEFNCSPLQHFTLTRPSISLSLSPTFPQRTNNTHTVCNSSFSPCWPSCLHPPWTQWAAATALVGSTTLRSTSALRPT